MKIMILSLFFLNLFLLIKNQLDDETTMRALSCVSVITQKFKGQESPEASIYSPPMLSCFIKISLDQAQEILSNLESGVVPLEPEEIDELTNVESLRDMPQEELKRQSQELERAIKEFQKYDEDFNKLKEKKENENSDDNDNDKDNKNNTNKKEKYLKKIKEFIQENKSLWFGILICIVVFSLVLIFGKSTEEKEIENKYKNN